MPSRFMWRGADVYLPDVFHQGQTVEGERSVHLLGRLKPGVTREQASTGLQPLLQDMAARAPGRFSQAMANPTADLWGDVSQRDSGCPVDSVRRGGTAAADRVRQRVEPAAVERGVPAARDRDSRGDGRGPFPDRAATALGEPGAGRSRGGAVGVLLAYAGLRGIIAVVPPNTIPDEAQITLNAPVLLFTLVVSVVVSLLFGVDSGISTGGPRSADAAQGGGPGRFRRRAAARDARRAGGGRGGAFPGAAGGREPDDPHAAFDSGRQSGLSPGPDPDAADSVLRTALPGREPPQRLPAGRAAENAEPRRGVLAVGINAGLPPVYNWSFPVEAVGSTQQDTRPVLVHQTNAGLSRG